jgi:uncharacterized OB-fold protein
MTRTRQALNPEQLALGEQGPVLLGSYCPQCCRSYFPRRWECAADQVPTQDVELSRRGVLRVATNVQVASYGKNVLDGEGYGVGEIDLPEGVRIQSVLGGTPADWTPGRPMSLGLQVVPQPGDDGPVIVTFQFDPEGVSS